MTGDRRDWQFSLRAMFGLTTLCALFLSLDARHPGTLWVVGMALLIGVGILVMQLVWIGVPVGVTVVGEMLLEKIIARWRPARGCPKPKDRQARS